MSVTITEDEVGTRLTLAGIRDERWRIIVGRALLAAVGVALLVAYVFLGRDLQVGWLEALAVVGVFGSAAAGGATLFVYGLLKPRSGVERLSFDRAAGEMVLVQHTVFQTPKPLTIPLAQLAGVTLMAGGLPTFSIASLFRVGKAVSEGAEASPDLFSQEPLDIGLRLEMDGEGGARSGVIRLGIEGVTNDQTAVELAFRIAAAAGLPYGGVYRMSTAGLEVRLDREERRGSTQLGWTGRSDSDLTEAATRALAEPKTPPFDPGALKADHRVAEWRPGRHVVLERPLGAGVGCLPFSVLMLAGPAVLVYADLSGRQVSGVGVAIFGVMGFVVGGLALLAGGLALPRRVTVDWTTRTVAIRRWFRTRVVPFDGIEAVELQGRWHESGGGDSGGGTPYYYCVLCLRPQRDGDADGEPWELLSTSQTRDVDEPWRQATPLHEELAAALGVEARTAPYDFRREKPSEGAEKSAGP